MWTAGGDRTGLTIEGLLIVHFHVFQNVCASKNPVLRDYKASTSMNITALGFSCDLNGEWSILASNKLRAERLREPKDPLSFNLSEFLYEVVPRAKEHVPTVTERNEQPRML